MANTTGRSLRVDHQLWVRFGVVTLTAPGGRSEVLRNLMELYIALGPQLCTEFVQACDEPIADVLADLMGWYLGRSELPRRPAA
jgi:hypothetical protein